jgi:drug/metabolite transporter (DMT)-like permease
MVWATACLVPMSLVIDRPWTLRPSMSSVLAAVALGFFGTGVALLLYFRLVKTVGSMGVASQSYLRAGVSVLLGIFVLGEQLTWSIAIGLVAVILGVVLINTSTAAPGSRLLQPAPRATRIAAERLEFGGVLGDASLDEPPHKRGG